MRENSLDRLYTRFVPGVCAPPTAQRAYWFLFHGERLLLQVRDGSVSIPIAETPEDLGVTPLRRQYLGRLDGVDCFSGAMADASSVPAGLEASGLRELFGRIGDTEFWIAGRAWQIVEWDRTHRFCGACGTPTKESESERARECANCGLVFYPRISPAVIILIERGDEVLLARSHRLPAGMYSVVAGFVEAGETLEMAAEREILEETGVRVRNLRYFCSQPWPFPHSLMLAFTAEYESGEIRIDPEEIADAGWYRYDRMPRTPGPLSVAGRLIEGYLRKHIRVQE